MKQIPFLALLLLLACNNDSVKTTQQDSLHHTGPGTAVENGQDSVSATDLHGAMAAMMENMKRMQVTGDPDYDFAMMMKLHHEGAIAMARAEIAGGSDSTIRKKAEQIVADQQKEIDQFIEYMNRNTNPTGKHELGKKLMTMMSPADSSQHIPGDIDASFVNMMIPHHQDAVSMAKEYIYAGRDNGLKEMANNIISSQEKEITEFRAWLAGKGKTHSTH